MKTIIKSEVPPCLRQAQGKGWNWDEFRTKISPEAYNLFMEAMK